MGRQGPNSLLIETQQIWITKKWERNKKKTKNIETIHYQVSISATLNLFTLWYSTKVLFIFSSNSSCMASLSSFFPYLKKFKENHNILKKKSFPWKIWKLCYFINAASVTFFLAKNNSVFMKGMDIFSPSSFPSVFCHEVPPIFQTIKFPPQLWNREISLLIPSKTMLKVELWSRELGKKIYTLKKKCHETTTIKFVSPYFICKFETILHFLKKISGNVLV